jgi:hypothetical protein
MKKSANTGINDRKGDRKNSNQSLGLANKKSDAHLD